MTTYALIGFWTVALMTPGLDFAIVTQNAIAKGSRAGIWTAFGVAIGLCVHFFYVTLLLQSVSAAMQSWMWCLQFLGALFLLYIAAMIFYDLWRPMRSSRQATKLPMQSAWLQGFLTNVLNPKVGLLSISLFSSYLRGHDFVMLYGLYGVFVGMTFLWFTLVAVFWNQAWFKKSFQRYEKSIACLMGGYFVFLSYQVLAELFTSPS